jgi:nucleoside-diphosphate-sugar epimerase
VIKVGTPRASKRRGIDHVLVIGGAGYVGSVLVRKLLDRGYGVTVLDALMYGDEGMDELYGNSELHVMQGDFRDIETLVTACRHVDAVVHLGAIVGDPACDLDHRLTAEVNLEATRTVAAVARGMGIGRFVFSSTCAVYGASDDLLDEESSVDPVSLYAMTKMGSEEHLLSMNGGNFAPVVLRFGTFYGASPRPRFDLVVNLLAAKAVTEGEITIIGGSQWRPFIHVDDGAEAIIKCLEAPARVVANRVFNVGSDDQNYTMLEIGNIIAAGVPDAQVRVQPSADHEPNYRVSFARIRRDLKFAPRHTLADGIAEIRAAIEAGNVSDFHDARYSNQLSMAVGESARILIEGDGEAVASLASG